MPFLGDSFRPRRSLDIRVGKFHILEVLLHMRHVDWKYWKNRRKQDDDNDNDTGDDITAEFLELLHERIIPRVFGTELEAYHRSKNPDVLPPESSEYYGDALTTTSKKKKGNAKKRAAAAPKGKKGQTKNNSDTASATAASKKKKTSSGAAAAIAALEDEDGAEKPEKDVYFSFGDTIQLSYRREPTSSCRTIFFQSKEEVQKDDSNNKSKSKINSGFKDYIKLSHRLAIWISRIDPNQKTNPDPKGVGFYRPEMIPMSSLFRQPKDVLGDDDDDD